MIKIFEGERAAAGKNRFFGTLKFERLPPEPKGVHEIEVVFEMYSTGDFTVVVKEKASGMEERLAVEHHEERYTPEKIDANHDGLGESP